jgi:hypothetical protein
MESKNFREAFEKIGRKHNDLPPIQPSNEKLTQLAGDFINERQLDVDLDSFLRGFRRYKKNKDK